VSARAKVPTCPRPARLAAAAGPRRFAGCCLPFPVRGMPAQAPVYPCRVAFGRLAWWRSPLLAPAPGAAPWRRKAS